jgi:hypothetical protein
VTDVLAGACFGERIGARVGQAHRIIQLAIGQQPGIGRVAGPRNCSINRRSKSSLSASLVASPAGFVIAAPIGCF